ncbi:hypothetical protein AWC38_SpisGene11967 [Stylophora pistillata]|uniref:Uncharacterized protein n=1 Tax=Stylophora pistillata TaxID=50429 RepID=A0A2B4S4N0_STYPI|nr:hypothetical protein AWC38_SpisGene11967 [Stylophora pistillata]
MSEASKEQEAITDIIAMNILEAEATSDSDHGEQLAVLVASGRAKEMIGVSLTQDQVKRLSEKDVEKYFKRYEASISSKTCDVIVDTFLQLSFKALAYFLPVNEGKLMKDLNDDFIVKRELGMIAGSLSLKYGKYMVITSAALLTAKNVEVPLKPNMVNVEVEKIKMEEKESQEPAEQLTQHPAELSPPAQQVTSTVKKKTKLKKDPGCVAAGKKLAEHNRRVGEQKKVNALKQPNLEPEPKPEPSSSSSFSLTQILSVASIVLSLAGLYYKRKELMELVKS